MTIPDFTNQPIAALIGLKGRSAVITGGAQGIGLAIARRLAEAGAKIAIGDLDETLARKTAEELHRDFGVDSFAAVMDVRKADSVASFAQAAEDALGPTDIWVNNAGVYPMNPILEITEEEWDNVSDVNLRGVFLCSREATRRMMASADKRGRVIINLSSMSGVRGRAGLTHYTATKHGVIGFTKSLAIELGVHGIRVLGVAPTLVSTPGLAARQAGQDAETVAEFEKGIAAKLPLGRIAVPDDVARVVLFCASDMAALMTGSTVMVDAGASAG